MGYDFTTDAERDANDDSLSARLFGDDVDSFRCTVAWDRVDIPTLAEPVVERDAPTDLEA